MKGIVFTGFLEFIEETYGFDAADAVIETSGLECIYTQAGNYPFEEMATLLASLAQTQNVDASGLLEQYGIYLFKHLISIYPNGEKFSSSFELIRHVDNIIHPEVHKLYPDADLPSFQTILNSDNRLLLRYRSDKGLHNFAKGLMLGAAKYFGEDIAVTIDTEKNPVELEVVKNNG